MNIVIHPEYSSLEPFVKNMPALFQDGGRTIYKARNEIRVFDHAGMQLNVKSYRKPILINQIVYSFFRKSKARRAFENGLEVLKRGFDTPKPVAYIENFKLGLLKSSYFISFQSPYSRRLVEFADNSGIEGREDIPAALGVYAAKLHEADFLHLDFSSGNVLFKKDEMGVHFSLVDLNRMRFCKIDESAGCKNFERLRANPEFFKLMARSYAQARGFDADKCLNLMESYKAESIKRFHRKAQWKKIRRLIKPKTYAFLAIMLMAF